VQVGDLVRFKKPLPADDTATRREMFSYKFEMGLVLTESKRGEVRVMFPSLTCDFITHMLEVISSASR